MTQRKTRQKEDGWKCAMCGCTYAVRLDNFFKQQSPLYAGNDGFSTICKQCVSDIFDKYKIKYNDELKALYYLCLKLDVYYSEKNYNSIKDKDIDLAARYISIMNLSENAGRCFDDSIDEGVGIGELGKSRKEIERLTREIDALNMEIDTLTHNSRDKIYSTEWMGEYTVAELEYLNNYYIGLHNDYKVITENHKDYARKISQASLYMNRCFQELVNGTASNMDAYVKARDTFDTLCKSAKFSEQTRGINDVSLGGYGVTAELVERGEWIPTHTPIEKDDVDKLIEYFATIQDSI